MRRKINDALIWQIWTWLSVILPQWSLLGGGGVCSSHPEGHLARSGCRDGRLLEVCVMYLIYMYISRPGCNISYVGPLRVPSIRAGRSKGPIVVLRIVRS
jgi:hypothetical protein